MTTPKWYEGFESTVHPVDNNYRQVRVYYFPNMPDDQPKVIQFQLYDQNDPLRQIANLLESAIHELNNGC